MFFCVFGVGKEKIDEEVIRKQVILLLTEEMQSTEYKCSDVSSVRACSKGKSPHSLEHGRYMTHFLVEMPDVETLGNAHSSSLYVMFFLL